MIEGLSILAVVPARGGSKGVPLKNIRPLWGRPLIAHTAELIGSLAEIDRAVVSTDHDEIASTAEAYGLGAPFRRPESLGGDRIGDLDVLLHALETMDRLDGCAYDVVLMLQPTCPQRTAAHVRSALCKLASGSWDAVWTVSPTDLKYHPLKALTVDGEGGMDFFDPRGAEIIARQQLVPTYYRNGAAYAIRSATLRGQLSIKGARAGAIVIPEPLVSIDTLDDFAALEKLGAPQR